VNRAKRVVSVLVETYPATYSLNFSSPFELLIAALLAVRCTDERVNQITPQLFARYPDAETLAGASQGHLEQELSGLSLFRRKATQLIDASRLICAMYGGSVPTTRAELLQLPGVGDKTAALVLGLAFGDRSALPIDTHVMRVARRTGLSGSETSAGVAGELTQLIGPTQRLRFALAAVQHGRLVCLARSPRCQGCVVLSACDTGQRSDLGTR
jgi:endonuclease-3